MGLAEGQMWPPTGVLDHKAVIRTSLDLVITHKGVSGPVEAGGPGVSWNQQKPSYDGHPHPISPCQFVMPSGTQGLLTRCLLSTIFSHFSLICELLWRILAKHGRALDRSLGSFSRLQLGNISLEQVDKGLAGTTLPDFITREWDRDPYGGHPP